MTFNREKSFEAIVNTVVDAIVVCNKNNEIRYFNPGAETLLGWKADEVIGKDMGMIIPEQYREMHKKGMQRYLDTRVPKVLGTPFVFLPSLHKDGHEIPTNISIATWDEGEETFFTGVIRDVTKTVELSEQQNLLIRELNHRVKNTISIIQGMINQAAKTESNVDDYRQDIEERLVGLAKVHDLLVDTSWSHTSINKLVHKFLDSYKYNYTYNGPDIDLKPRVAVSMGMAIHELATNAMKYGSWSENGTVNISTDITDDCFTFVWKERGGPMLVNEKHSEGFGTTLLTRVISGSLRGQSHIEFEPDGLRFCLKAPFSTEIKRHMGD